MKFRYKIPKDRLCYQVFIGSKKLASDEFTVGRNGDLVLKNYAPDSHEIVTVVTKDYAVPRKRVRAMSVGDENG